MSILHVCIIALIHVAFRRCLNLFALPCLAPCLALPSPRLPCLNLCFALPCIAPLPCVALPCLALPCPGFRFQPPSGSGSFFLAALRVWLFLLAALRRA